MCDGHPGRMQLEQSAFDVCGLERFLDGGITLGAVTFHRTLGTISFIRHVIMQKNSNCWRC